MDSDRDWGLPEACSFCKVSIGCLNMLCSANVPTQTEHEHGQNVLLSKRKSALWAKCGRWQGAACGHALVHGGSQEVKWKVNSRNTQTLGRKTVILSEILNVYISIPPYPKLQCRLLNTYSEKNKVVLLFLNQGCVGSNSFVRPQGLWEDTPPLCSWLVSLFHLRQHGPGHWLECCFSAHTALRGSDLNTSNKAARTGATAVEDWNHTSSFI